MVQTITADGLLRHEPATFGIVASANDITLFCDQWESADDLNRDIANSASILAALPDHDSAFPEADHAKIGRDNYYGKSWRLK
jgi:hypothetical protein